MENKPPDSKPKESVTEEILQYENVIDPGNEHHHHAEKEEEPGDNVSSGSPAEEGKETTDNKPG